jgi:HEAT repeat protein
LKQVLECLLDHKADLIFRYPDASSRSAAQIQPEEVWVLKTKFEVLPGTANSSVYKTVVTQQQTMQTTAGAQADTEYTAADQTNALIEKAGSKNPSDRSDAIAELQEALHDNDASVRLMAVNSIGNNADLLQQALTDSDDKVRKLAAMKLESLSNAEPRQQVMQKTASAQTDNEPSTPDQIDALLERAKSNNPVDRVDAISRLLTAGKAGDASVRTVLEEALADNYASVRAQAISSLARSEGDDATAALQVALNDSDASVRLMAVDSMGSNTALLQQALTDNDATVRELAKIRLESLSNSAIYE